MFCHWALAPGKVDYPDIETAQMMSLLHTLQWFATALSPQSELLPMDSWIWKSVLFFLTECWDFPLLKTKFTHSPLSFLIMSCFSQLNSLWACSSLNYGFFHSTYNHCSLKNKNQDHYQPLPPPATKVLVLVTFLQDLFLTIYHKSFCHFKLELLACFYNGIKHNV